jgi:formylglycine-generating enzyme required for sulfatase activity
MNKFLLLTLLALGYQTASATSLLETFGSGANQFSMEFVTIGNPNNAADTTGAPNPAGSVAYTYNLAKYEVSREQIDKANVAGSLGITLAEMGSYGGNGLLKPATGISWYQAAKYVNYLNTSTGGTAAYKFDGSGTFQLWSSTDAGYNANNMFRNSLAKYWLPSTNEWYKGAYGKADGSWSNFPNGTDSAPTAVAGGTAANTAVYGQSGSTGPANITSAGGLSAYGTMGQGGNVWEWMETAYDGINNTAGENRELRGGSWNFYSSSLDASFRVIDYPTRESIVNGFRVASVPEPTSFSLLVLGGLVVALRRRRKQS